MPIADAFAAATAKILESKLIAGCDKEFKELHVQLLKIRE